MSDDDKRKKIIDVSKPKHTPPASNIDTSRVSAYTQREQDSRFLLFALEKEYHSHAH